MEQRSTFGRPRFPLALAILVAGVGVVAFAVGVTARSGGTGDAGASGVLAASSPSPAPASPGTNGGGFPGWGRGGRGMMGGPGMMGPGMMGGPGFFGPGGVNSDDGWVGPGGGRGRHALGDITITAIDGSKLSLKTTEGWTRTIDTAGATVTRAGQTVGLDTLKVGDQIVFSQTRQTDGTYKIDRIAVVLPQASGTVSAVDATSLTLTQRDGSTKKIVLDSSTVYRLDGQASTKSALTSGSVVVVTGSVAGDGTFTADAVDIKAAVVSGTVKSKTSGTIVLTARDGSTVTVKVSSSTTYQVAGVTSASLADVAVGAFAAASGTRNADSSLSAIAVRAFSADQLAPGRGFGPRGWGWPGWPNQPSSTPAPSPNQG